MEQRQFGMTAGEFWSAFMMGFLTAIFLLGVLIAAAKESV